MKRIVPLFFAVLFVIFSLAGCSRYVSHYSAVGYVRDNRSGSASMSFLTFEGAQVFQLKSDGNTGLNYSGKLETGSLTVYYDCGGTKNELFSLQSGDAADSSIPSLTKGMVYIIVETSEKCENGELFFEISSD